MHPKIKDYISTFEPETQKLLHEMYDTIRAEVPEDTEEAISYGMPTFKYKGKNLVHFAGYKKHIGFYPTPSGIELLGREAEKYHFSKGTMRFPLDKKLPLSVIRKVVQGRLDILNDA